MSFLEDWANISDEEHDDDYLFDGISGLSQLSRRKEEPKKAQAFGSGKIQSGMSSVLDKAKSLITTRSTPLKRDPSDSDLSEYLAMLTKPKVTVQTKSVNRMISDIKAVDGDRKSIVDAPNVQSEDKKLKSQSEDSYLGESIIHERDDTTIIVASVSASDMYNDDFEEIEDELDEIVDEEVSEAIEECFAKEPNDDEKNFEQEIKTHLDIDNHSSSAETEPANQVQNNESRRPHAPRNIIKDTPAFHPNKISKAQHKEITMHPNQPTDRHPFNNTEQIIERASDNETQNIYHLLSQNYHLVNNTKQIIERASDNETQVHPSSTNIYHTPSPNYPHVNNSHHSPIASDTEQTTQTIHSSLIASDIETLKYADPRVCRTINALLIDQLNFLEQTMRREQQRWEGANAFLSDTRQ
jgi:hypothetical protein